jgi:hypothetical protein
MAIVSPRISHQQHFSPNQMKLAVSLQSLKNNEGLTGFDSKDSGIVSMPGL